MYPYKISTKLMLFWQTKKQLLWRGENLFICQAFFATQKVCQYVLLIIAYWEVNISKSLSKVVKFEKEAISVSENIFCLLALEELQL